jgi:hypothetical protein
MRSLVQLGSVQFLLRKFEEITEFCVKSRQSAIAEIFCFPQSYVWVISQKTNKLNVSHHPATPWGLHAALLACLSRKPTNMISSPNQLFAIV